MMNERLRLSGPNATRKRRLCAVGRWRLSGDHAFIDKPGRGAYLSRASSDVKITPFSGALSRAPDFRDERFSLIGGALAGSEASPGAGVGAGR
jgi:hypothetical protein